MKHFILELCAEVALVGCVETTGSSEDKPEPTPIATKAQFAEYYGKKLVNGRDKRYNSEQFITLSSNGSIGGSWDGANVTGSFEIINGKFCRDVTIGSRAFPYQCQTWLRGVGETDSNIIYGFRPAGEGNNFHYTIE